MKFKTQPPAAPEPEEREDVRVAANRCPYCRDDVAPDRSVVCQDCLTRHHSACWTEAGACSSCGGARRMERKPEPVEMMEDLHRRMVAREHPAVRWGVGALFLAICVGAVVLTLVGLWTFLPKLPTDSDALGALIGTIVLGALLVFAAFPSAKLRLWDYDPDDPDRPDDPA